MIIVDTALKKRAAEGRPIRVGMVGSGFMARGIAIQITDSVPGMELCAIAARRLDQAEFVFNDTRIGEDVLTAETVDEISAAIAAGKPVITTNSGALARAEGLDAIIDATGSMDYTLDAVEGAFETGKHVILMNAELDGTVGPLLKAKADKAGVIFTNTDGDQPGVQMNLYRFVQGIGVKPLLCGNIKGLQDPYRTPTTQAGFAKQWGQKPSMVTSFADGTKISFEQAIVANATGMTVAKRGMHGFTVEPGTPITEAAKLYDPEELISGPGIVDYVVGAQPGPGVFVLGTIEHPRQKHYLNLYKLGEGPLYCFYTPYHLCHFEVPATIARAALFGDAAIAPIAGPEVEVVALAKRDLKAGEAIDELGGYTVYGEAEAAGITARDNLLPIGVAVGATLKRDLPKDAVLTYADVELPEGRLVDRLRLEQAAMFNLKSSAA